MTPGIIHVYLAFIYLFLFPWKKRIGGKKGQLIDSKMARPLASDPKWVLIDVEN